jgi:hypothetical protein
MKGDYNMTFRVSSKEGKDLVIVEEEYFKQPNYLKYEVLQELEKFVDVETKRLNYEKDERD